MKYFSKQKIESIKYRLYLMRLRQRLKNENFSIICNNCIAGVLYHNLGKRFDSPTINLFITGNDYLAFVKDLKYYCACDIDEISDASVNYPIGVLVPMDKNHIPIKIHFQHYDSFKIAKQKWQERCARIHWDNLHFIWVFYDNVYPLELAKEFDLLPIHKIILTHRNIEGINHQFALPFYEREYKTALVFEKSKDTGRLYLDDWDYVSFLNGDK